MTLDGLLSEAVTRRASDLHVSVGVEPVIRVDGDVVRIGDDLPLASEQVEAMLRDVMTADQYDRFTRERECDFSLEMRDGHRCRVNAYQQVRGAAAAFRLIPPCVRTLDDLQCPDVIRQLVDRPKGLVLVTGQTGAGKSTTLAAVVDHLNRSRPFHIITIEDPVEVIHASARSVINQREVGRHTRSFSAALRSALREDPDCILVGELRDRETIQLALTAAETGHLVLATLHTNSAPHTLDRMIDVFPAEEKAFARAMLAECLTAVVCQTLVKRRAGVGRVAAWEVMVCVPAIRNLIREGKTAQIYSVMQTGSEYGMFTMQQCLSAMRKDGLIDGPDETISTQFSS
ncbi:type IV pilus twitching motility protein PilT [Burkholderia gladioli]|uniref:type IV pilus twitching motility protein PilT n=1 Tax=Burkholderia gladioli TaxID=28095 RepID=UPI00163E86F0|nr:type IV pilus twitching motility protein PilT [Burkholderia gladioli]